MKSLWDGLHIGLSPRGGASDVTSWAVDASGNWETATNWSPKKVPSGPKAKALLGSKITAPRVVTLTAPNTVKALSFNAAFAYTLAGSALTVPAIAVKGTGIPVISAPLVGTAGLSVSVDNSATISGAISGTTITKTGAGTLTVSGSNAYSGNTVISAGTLKVGALATLPVATMIMGPGTLDITGYNTTVGCLGDNTAITLGAATLTIDCATAATFTGVISGTGSVVKAGVGTQTIAATQTFTGGLTINAGTIKLGSVDPLATVDVTFADVASATLDLNGISETIGSLIGGGATGGTVTSTNGACTLTFGDADNDSFSGRIRDSLSVVKVGAGNYTLSGANDYTGTTAINVGTIITGANNALPTTSVITTANTAGAGLTIGAFTQSVRSIAGGGSTGGGLAISSGGTFTVTNTSSTSFSGLISGAGDLTHAGTAQFTIALSSTLSGTLTVSSGATLSGAATSATGLGPMVLSSGSTLKKDTNARTFNNSIYTFQPGTIILDPNTAGTLTLGTGQPTFAGAVTINVPQGQVSLSALLAETGGSGFDLIKTGAGELKINAASATRTGDVYILAGRMASGSTSAWTTAGTIYLGDTTGSNTAEIGLTTGSNPRALTVRAGSSGQKIMTRNSNNPTLAGALTLNDDLRLNTGAGAFTFSGTVTGTGSLRLITSAGSLAWSAASKSGWTGSIYGESGTTTLSLSGGATGASGTAAITISASSGCTVFCNSAFSGTGAAVIGGGGLGGTSSYGGDVTIQSGARIIGGSGASNAGTFTVNGNLTLDSGATMTCNIAGGNTVGKVTTLGNLVLNGNIPTFQAVALAAGTYPLFNYSGSLTGSLGTPVLTGTGRTFSSYTSGAGVYSIVLT